MNYIQGLERLKKLIEDAKNQSDLNDFHVYEARLLENVHFERLYGALTAEMRVQRTEIVMWLNKLASRYPVPGRERTSFNDLCK
jgi:hypothetical protein